jgi:hypothetical protein
MLKWRCRCLSRAMAAPFAPTQERSKTGYVRLHKLTHTNAYPELRQHSSGEVPARAHLQSWVREVCRSARKRTLTIPASVSPRLVAPINPKAVVRQTIDPETPEYEHGSPQPGGRLCEADLTAATASALALVIKKWCYPAAGRNNAPVLINT